MVIVVFQLLPQHLHVELRDTPGGVEWWVVRIGDGGARGAWRIPESTAAVLLQSNHLPSGE
jgi:hypothetical protein